jgi:1-acyl-sn-glycerol-3-phosphate acyltransferase
MAAWQVFLAHRGIDGWVMQRFGAFSVDREGCDRRAIRQATELLTSGQWLVVFPEGEIYHTNERLTPLREGVAFMGITAQRDLQKDQRDSRVWIVPAAIRYAYEEDVTPKLVAAVEGLEKRFMLGAGDGATLPQRIVRLGEVLLTIQEKQKLGHSRENEGDVPQRIKHFIATLLERLESQHLGKASADDSVPVRVKSLRRHLLEAMCEDDATSELKAAAHHAFDDLHLVLQLYSYPGDYVSSNPTLERMAETIEKFEEDTTGFAAPKGRRRATVTFGDPIDVRPMLASRPRAATAELTTKLENALRDLMSAEKSC